MSSRRKNQQGIAMVTAIVLAIIVSVMAVVVLNLTFRRFEMSAFRTDHAVAYGSAEAGFQYVFARMDRDTTYNDPLFPGPPNGFEETVRRKRLSVAGEAVLVPADNQNADYVVTCHADAAADENQVVPALHMGNAEAGKHVTVRVRWFTAADLAGLPASQQAILQNRPYRVRSISSFGTGGQ